MADAKTDAPAIAEFRAAIKAVVSKRKRELAAWINETYRPGHQSEVYTAMLELALQHTLDLYGQADTLEHIKIVLDHVADRRHDVAGNA